MSTTPTNAAHRAAQPFKGPFAVLSVSSVDRAVLSYRVIDAERMTIADRLSQKEAQWLCDRLNHTTPTAIPEGSREAEGYVALSVYESAVQGRRDFRAALEIVRSEVQAIRHILAGTDIAALPNDYPTVRMAKDRMADLQAAQQRPAGDVKPVAYIYRYPDGLHVATVIRFSHDENANGSNPLETIPLYATPPLSANPASPEGRVELQRISDIVSGVFKRGVRQSSPDSLANSFNAIGDIAREGLDRLSNQKTGE